MTTEAARLTLTSIAIAVMMSGYSHAQEVEIFIPNETSQENLADEGADIVNSGSRLARCLFSNSKADCTNLRVQDPVLQLETFVGNPDVSVEIFVLEIPDDRENQTSRSTDSQNYATPSTPKSVSAVGIEISFNFNSDKIRDDQIYKIDAIANALTDRLNSSTRFAVVGHTNSVGSDQFNCNLSSRRADVVVRGLIERGVAGKISPNGVGESLHKNPDDPENSVNRRVSFI